MWRNISEKCEWIFPRNVNKYFWEVWTNISEKCEQIFQGSVNEYFIEVWTKILEKYESIFFANQLIAGKTTLCVPHVTVHGSHHHDYMQRGVSVRGVSVSQTPQTDPPAPSFEARWACRLDRVMCSERNRQNRLCTGGSVRITGSELIGRGKKPSLWNDGFELYEKQTGILPLMQT